MLQTVFTSKYFASRLVSSMEITFDSRSPMEAKYSLRLGTALRKSSFLMDRTPCGPPNIKASAYRVAIAATSDSEMACSYCLKNACCLVHLCLDFHLIGRLKAG